MYAGKEKETPDGEEVPCGSHWASGELSDLSNFQGWGPRGSGGKQQSQQTGAQVRPPPAQRAEPGRGFARLGQPGISVGAGEELAPELQQ